MKKVFLDAQVEVNVNWLPPLLGNKICTAKFYCNNRRIAFAEPIALNPRVITTPIVDSIAFDTFEYRKLDDGGRGIFNWNLHYRRFPRRPQDSVNLDEPIPSPVMVSFTAYLVRYVLPKQRKFSCRLAQHLLFIAVSFGTSVLSTMDLRYGKVNNLSSL